MKIDLESVKPFTCDEKYVDKLIRVIGRRVTVTPRNVLTAIDKCGPYSALYALFYYIRDAVGMSWDRCDDLGYDLAVMADKMPDDVGVQMLTLAEAYDTWVADNKAGPGTTRPHTELTAPNLEEKGGRRLRY